MAKKGRKRKSSTPAVVGRFRYRGMSFDVLDPWYPGKMMDFSSAVRELEDLISLVLEGFFDPGIFRDEIKKKLREWTTHPDTVMEYSHRRDTKSRWFDTIYWGMVFYIRDQRTRLDGKPKNAYRDELKDLGFDPDDVPWKEL